MSQILNKIRDVDPNDSDAVKEALTTFFQNLSKHSEVDCNRWLLALEHIITRFPKYCTTHRNTIETYLTKFLDSNNYYNVIDAAKCTHVLQQVKVTQEKGVIAKVTWREQMNTLCQSAHELINVIFPNNVKIFRITKAQQEQSPETPMSAVLSKITNVGKTPNKETHLCTRLKNIFVFIQAMLVEVYPVAKPVRPQIILEVILQALTVSSGKNVSANVTEVKMQALKTLDALIACLGSNLIPFSALVFRFVMQTLRWSSDNVSEETSKVRRAAYSSLNQWLDTLRVHQASTGSSDHSWQDELTAHLVTDIKPTRKVVQLTMNLQPNKHLSKKAKRKLANTMLQESTISSHMPGEKNKVVMPEEVNEEVALAALECTETFLRVCGIFLKPSTYKIYQELLVRECYQLSAYSVKRALLLLRALESARTSGPVSGVPHTQYCLQLYSTLIHSPHRQISKLCAQALLDIRLHLHCSPPSLNFALEAHSDKKKAESKQKKISQRNRAVLEQLLGSERMPSEDLAEQVITIPDEPNNKKPRLDEDVADKISLSSESLNSVVVSCDDSDDETHEQDVLLIEDGGEITKPANETNTNHEDNSVRETVSETTNVIEGMNKNVDKANLQKIEGNENIVESSNPVTENIVGSSTETANIFEAKTQMPRNESMEAQDRQSPLSMEVAYDYPNTGNDTVRVLDKLDDENLPSTNDTDDIQITCGQVVKSSPEADHDKSKDVEVSENVPKVNGITKSPEKNATIEEETNVTAKIALSNDTVTVEDMLADFVDEVKDDAVKT